MDLAGAAARFREIAQHAEESLALDAARAAADVALPQLKIVTPVLSGDLQRSEHIDAVFGGGTHATAVLAPHKIYAAFRNYGGTITAKRFPQLGNPEAGFFGKSVTQEGAHYLEKGEAAGRGPVREAVSRVAAFYFTL